MTNYYSPEQLSSNWAEIHKGALEAIGWITKTRAGDKLVDNDADDLILNLRRIRNSAKRLGGVTKLPMTVGFFGLSQAGKSYLISALAAGANGKLETNFGGERLDFISHINPAGGGKEATALVTRFSRTARPGTNDFPVELKLFTEIELAKVLANSFFNDFNREKIQYELDEVRIRKLLFELEKRRQTRQVAGIDEDDVVSLWDYLMESFPASIKGLQEFYWPKVVELAPYLLLEDRTQLFSIFWGGIPELSAAYLEFAHTLRSLGNVDTVFAPLDVLVRRNQQGDFSQTESIMNVDNLQRLGKAGDRQVSVCPQSAEGLQDLVTLSLAQLSALTAELVFPLAEKTSEKLFESVDLLDFPGYRGRLNVESFEDVRAEFSESNANPLAQLILRGKVAYLFERYTESQEMNVLIVCTPGVSQSEVTSVGPVLSKWIEKTQGENPQLRSQRKSGLLWAITMYDLRIGADLNKSEELLKDGFRGLMKQTILEKFGQYSWLQEWVPNKPFDNTFLVRKPRMPGAFLNQNEHGEIEIKTESLKQLDLMQRLFCEDQTVARHVRDAELAWRGMLALNDGGMGRIGEYLREVARPEVKLNRLHEQMHEMLNKLESRLKIHHQGDQQEELLKKRAIVKRIYAAIRPRQALLGELMQQMQLPEDELRMLYLSAGEIGFSVSENEKESAPANDALNLGNAFDEEPVNLFDDEVSKPGNHDEPGELFTAKSSDARFAQSVLRKWFSHLYQIPENQALVNYLGYDKPVVTDLVSELHLGAERLSLEQKLFDNIANTEQTGTTREKLVSRQVLTARTILADFIAWLGVLDKDYVDRPESRVKRGSKLFKTPEDIALHALPNLPDKPTDFSSNYIADWFVALMKMAEDNAGQESGRGISPEQNESLGRILAGFRSVRAS
jgi:hypothetical protein